MAAITFGAFTHTRCIVPPTACRFARYFAASQHSDVKATLYEKFVYSLVLATTHQPAPATRG